MPRDDLPTVTMRKISCDCCGYEMPAQVKLGNFVECPDGFYIRHSGVHGWQVFCETCVLNTEGPIKVTLTEPIPSVRTTH